MSIHPFPFWEVTDRNVIVILQKSTLEGWKEASGITDRMTNPSRCTYTSKTVSAIDQGHPVSCKPRNAAVLSNWALTVEILNNLCPRSLPSAWDFIAPSTAFSKLCFVSWTFFVLIDMKSEKVPRGTPEKSDAGDVKASVPVTHRPLYFSTG